MAIDHCVRLAKGRKSKTAALEAEYDNLLRHIDPNDSAQRTQLLEINESLKVIEDERAEGIKIRSKENWLEFGEKPTKYFFQLEQTHTHTHKKMQPTLQPSGGFMLRGLLVNPCNTR